MKISSETPPIALDEAKIRACRTANTFVLPGIGSILAHRRVGYVQISIAAVGFALSNWWMFKTIAHFLTEGFIDLDNLGQLITPLMGIGLFALAWIWAQWTNHELKKSLLPEPPTRS